MRYLLATVVCVLALAGCSSSDNDDGPTPQDVAGSYSFAQLTFDPEASGLATYDLLERLVPAETKLHLFREGNFVMTYRFSGGQTRPVYGSYQVGESRLVLVPTAGMDDPFWRAVLGTQMSVSRRAGAPNILETSTTKTLDMGVFDSTLTGVTATGALQLRLER